jgi:hypothetical protein
VEKPLDLTGAWIADDGALYYIRQLDDNSIWWAGLHALGFHPGVTFTNVFQGVVISRDLTIVGSWADVPRGATFGHGKLSLEIVRTDQREDDTESRSERGTWPPGEAPPEGGPRQPSGRKLELRQIPERSTGDFGATRWRPWRLAEPLNIREKFRRVRRYDGAFDESNSAVRDFTVATGTIQAADSPHPSWHDAVPRDYWFFVTGFTGGMDGDLNFNIEGVEFEPGFWDPSDDWLLPIKIAVEPAVFGESAIRSLDSPDDVREYWEEKGTFVHDEGVMFGRTNTADDAYAEPNVLLPGWLEAGGDSILLNGRPVNGQVTGPVEAVSPYQVSVAGTTLVPGTRVRVTGVVNFDNHTRPALELHPVYSIDVLQDFRNPRPGADLTGVWDSNDVGTGTYYVRQLRDDTVWWLGLSRDQGRTFANVFHGHIRFRDDEGVRLETPVLVGDWVDVPVGTGGARSSGRVRLTGNTGTQIATAWILTTVERTFGASCLTKLFDSIENQPSVAIFSGISNVTHGQTLHIDRFDLDDGAFGQSYRLVMTNLVPPLVIEWSAAGIVSRPHDAATDITFTGLSGGQNTRGVAVRVTDANGQAFSLRFRVNVVIEKERVGK